MKNSLYSIPVALLILLSSCTTQGQGQPSAVAFITGIPMLDSTQVSTPIVLPVIETPISRAVTPIILDGAYDKAAFQAGPFDFEVYLFQDSSFAKNPTMTWMYSDIPGVGSHVAWTYHGPGIMESVSETWGTCPEVSPRNIYPNLPDEANSTREGGILLAPNATEDSIVQFVFMLEFSKGTYGGVLSFLLVQGEQGLEPSKVTVYGFDQPLQANGCIDEYLSPFKPPFTTTPSINDELSPQTTLPSGLNMEESDLQNVHPVYLSELIPLQGTQEPIIKLGRNMIVANLNWKES